MVWILVASCALEYSFFNITTEIKYFNLRRLLIDSVATAPPFILVFVLINAFCLMKNVGGELRQGI